MHKKETNQPLHAKVGGSAVCLDPLPYPRPIPKSESDFWKSVLHRSEAEFYYGSPAELCVQVGGTILAVQTGDGARPGLGVLDLLEREFHGKFVRDAQGLPPTLILPIEGSPYHFGQHVDSSQLQPEDFIKLAKIVHKLMFDQRVNRVTIITGTDTAEYLAAAIARMLSHPSKPVVIIGAMRTPDEADSDAQSNYFDGRFVAGQLDPGIYLYLDKDTHHACRVSKTHSTAIDAFKSLGAEPVATFRYEEQHPVNRLGLNYIPIRDLHHLSYSDDDLERAWEFNRRTNLPDDISGGAFRSYTSRQKKKAFREVREARDQFYEKYLKAGAYPNADDVHYPPQPLLNTKLDNRVIVERIIPGYKPKHLFDLLKRRDVHGLILDGIADLDRGSWDEVLSIIKRYSDRKPIVTMEDPVGRDSANTRLFHLAAREHGAIRSGGLTLAFGSITLKWLLGHKLEIEDIRTAWANAEYVGGTRYVPLAATPKSEHTFKKQIEPGIRYVHLIPGFEPSWLRAIYLHPDTRALIIGAFGTGNVPFSGKRDLLSLIVKHSQKIPTIFRTQCENGPTELGAYEPGMRAQRAGVISAGSLTLHQTIRRVSELLRTKEDMHSNFSRSN